MSWLDEQLKKEALIPSTEAPKVQAPSLQPASSDYATRMGTRPNPTQLPSSDWATRMGSKPVPLTGVTNQQTPQEPDYSNVQGADLDNIYDYVNRAKANARKSIDDQIADARRRKSTEAFGNMAQVLGQALNLGIGQRKFDKITPSTKWDERVEQLKQLGTQYDKAYDDMALSQAINEQVRRANARQQQYNFYLQNKYNQERENASHKSKMEEIEAEYGAKGDYLKNQYDLRSKLIAQQGEENRRTKATPSGRYGGGGSGSGNVNDIFRDANKNMIVPSRKLTDTEKIGLIAAHDKETYELLKPYLTSSGVLDGKKFTKSPHTLNELFQTAMSKSTLTPKEIETYGFKLSTDDNNHDYWGDSDVDGTDHDNIIGLED